MSDKTKIEWCDATERMAYVGRCKCGAIRAAAVDEPKYALDTAESVAQFIKDGLTVERIKCEDVRTGNWKCSCRRVEAGTLFGKEKP